MPSIYLGRNQLYWCRTCNIPILDSKKCPRCDNDTFKVKISPPYDCRPAFEYDIKRLKQVIKVQFGENCGDIIEENKVIILNKAPYHDRMDEVVIDGQIIGNIRFNILRQGNKWEFFPKIEGSRRIYQYDPKTWIKVDQGAAKAIIKGANLLAPGIIDFSNNIKENDTVFIITEAGKLIATGASRFSSDEIPKQKRGMIIKVKYNFPPGKPEILKGGQDWDQVIEINEPLIKAKERAAVKFIEKTAKKFADLPKILSFSGGKDSMALLLLLLKSEVEFSLFFIDTGIEFEETVDFVNHVVKKFDLSERFLKYESKNDFFQQSEESFGPPARDYRWCCKVLKLSNINDVIRDNFPNGMLTFIGNRKYESFLRSNEAKKGKISKNSYIPDQINVSPINNWNALLVWVYILREQKKYNFQMNPLYNSGYERVGCIYCPANKLADLEALKEIHPELHQKLYDLLKNYAEKNGYPEEWIEYGFWRWRNLPKSQLNLLKKLNLDPFKPQFGNKQNLKFNYTVGISPCLDGSVILEGNFNNGLDLGRMQNFLSPFGDLYYNSKNGILGIKSNTTLITIFADGTLKIRSYDGKEPELIELLEKLIPFVLKAQECIGCGICLEICPSGAIHLEHSDNDEDMFISIDQEKCTLCMKCLEKCPILNYAYRNILNKI